VVPLVHAASGMVVPCAGCECARLASPRQNTDFCAMPPRDSVARLELAGSIHAASAFINSYKYLLLNRPPNLPKRPNGCLRARRSEAWSISKTGPSSHSGVSLVQFVCR